MGRCGRVGLVRHGGKVIGVGLLILMATACGSAQATPPPQPTKPPGSPGEPQIIDTSATATSILAGVIIPSGSITVSQLSSSGLQEPAQRPACTPLIDVSKFWSVPGSYPALQKFLQSHPPAGMVNTGQGTWGGANGDGADVIDAPSGERTNTSTLVLSMVQLTPRRVGLRADAEIVSPHADCASGRAGAPSTGPLTGGGSGLAASG